MTVKNIMVKLKTALFLVCRLLLGRAILFHCIMENGAVYYRLPISAFIQRGYDPKDVPGYRLDELGALEFFLVTILLLLAWDILDAQSGKYIGKDKKWHHGKYLFTVDFAHPESNILDTDHSEIPHEHKCAHICPRRWQLCGSSQTIE